MPKSHAAPANAELVYDFDVFKGSAATGDVQQVHMDLHARAPDVFYTPLNGGHWMATRFADVSHIMTTPSVFSSRETNFPPAPPFFKLRLPPQDMDAPDHMRYRLLLLQFLAPKQVKLLEPAIRVLANALIDAVQDEGRFDFVRNVAVPLPVKTFMTMMHWDQTRYRSLVGWANGILGSDSLWKSIPAFYRMTRFLKSEVRRRRQHPGEDPISLLLASQINGRPIADAQVLQMCNLLFLAGLDTVTNAMTFIVKHLAENADVQRRLRDDPEQIPAAIEEFMRRYAFVNLPRKVIQDTQIGGAALKRGDLIVCSLAAASNDDRMVDNPASLDLGRANVRHLAFSTGPHVCAGAGLARLELVVFLEEWLRRMPMFELVPGFVPKARGGTVMALDSLPLQRAA